MRRPEVGDVKGQRSPPEVLLLTTGGGAVAWASMAISQDEFNKALGLPSNSPLTQEQAAKKLKDAFDAQEKELGELRRLFEQQLAAGQQAR